MRCLYCGKEMALLKRLRGGGEFCSEAHKQSYQEEYNRLALSRLLQAQNKAHQTVNVPAQNPAPQPVASVALEEPVLEEAASGTAEAAVVEVNVTEALAPAEPEAAIDSVAAEEAPSEAVVEAETSLGAEPEPAESAGFLFESLAVAPPVPDETPYLEPWLELSPGPAMSEWQTQNGAFSLSSSAELIALDLRPKVSSIGDHAWEADLSPQAFAAAQPDPPPPSAASAKKSASINRLSAGSAIAIDIAPSSVEPDADRSSVQAIGFESTVVFDESQLLELPASAIDFPAEDSGVVAVAGSQPDDAPHEAPNEAAPEVTPDAAASDAEPETPAAQADGPRASLEALSRLHQEIAEQEAAQAPQVVPVEEATPMEVAGAVAVEVVDRPDAVPDALPEPPHTGLEIVEVTAEESKPKFATDLFEISIKTFQPAKPVLIGGDAFPSNVAALLPHLKLLPLRPKVALATGYVPASKTDAPSEPKPAAPAAVRTQAPSKTVAAGKPAARLTQPKQPSQPAKPSQSGAVKAPEARTPAASKAASPKPDATKPDATKSDANPAPSEAAPVQEATAARPNVPEAPAKAPPAEKEEASKSAPAADQAKAVADKPKPVAGNAKPAEQAKPAAEQPKPAAEKAKPAAEAAKTDNVPHFDIAQPSSSSWIGSLKVKLGIAIVLLVIACVYFLGWGGGKADKPATSNSAVSADGSGPSIIMGEGGWVEGWAGDPSGMHAGRQITIYRPSLKLSDYRLEFQGSIDTKSVGWVFRAANPDNYYAMKLMTVSSGLSPKVALFKYLVANGKQTQVGRVPIDLAVTQDTVFNVRVDVRGPQFTTYLQGQQVDSWTDDQLKAGGAGFLNERDERGKVKSVSIRYLSGGAK